MNTTHDPAEALSLYELNSLVRGLLAEALDGEYWVAGELAEGRAAHGGHFYGELVQKDPSGRQLVARARVTCWSDVYAPLNQLFARETGLPLAAGGGGGLQVRVRVRVSFHEQYGYSLSIRDIDPAYSLGQQEQLRRRIVAQLEADGILHDNQTLPLPLLTQRIAVVSSATAAGYGDFCHQLLHNAQGYAFRLQLFPAVMQGEHVEESVIAALEEIAAQAGRWDAVALIRGGGAALDLSGFDSYPLGACIAQMPLPVLSGIGHERDETVADHVAHTRLKTPTAVAAFLLERLDEQARHQALLGQRLSRIAASRLAIERQRLDGYTTRLPLLFGTLRERQALRLGLLEQRLAAALRRRLEGEAARLRLLHTRLQGLDPALLLGRGYSITLCQGRLVRRPEDAPPGSTLTTRLATGEITSHLPL